MTDTTTPYEIVNLPNLDTALAGPGAATFRETAQMSIRELAGSRAVSSTASANITSDQVLHQIIVSNKLEITPIELDQWLGSSSQDFASNPEVARLDQQILKNLATSNPALALEAVSTATAVSLHSARKRMNVCRVTVLSPNGRTRNGTGFFLNKTSFLTCRHLFDDTVNTLSVHVDVPHFHGPGPISGVEAWSGKRYSVKESLGRPLFLAESPYLPRDLELADWPLPVQNTVFLDYCVLEIDESTEKWTISVTAEVDEIRAVSHQFVFYKLPNQFPNMRTPATLYEADELQGKTVEVHTLSSDLMLETVSGGSVTDNNVAVQRIRYGEGDNGINDGDSGSPLTNSTGELIALHNAFTGKLSQAVPIGPVFADIKKKNQRLYDSIFGNDSSAPQS